MIKATLLRWLRLLFRTPTPLIATTEPPPRVRAPQPKREDVHLTGSFYFKDDILDQLDDYFVVLRRMRKADRDTYDELSRLGAVVVPKEALAEDDLPPRFYEALPACGGVLIPPSADPKHHVSPRFVSFRKWERRGRPVTVEPCLPGETLYSLTFYWDDHHDKRPICAASDNFVALGPAGLRPLRTLAWSGQEVMARKRGATARNSYGSGKISIPTRRWQFDPWTVQSASERHEPSISDYVAKLFRLAVWWWEYATEGAMVRVAVNKDDLTASFSVNVERLPYFFADRDDRTGGKVFHIVRTHERQIGNRAIPVRMHFRGKRHFQWNGYDVLVSVPGWHHRSLHELGIAAWHRDAITKRERKKMVHAVVGTKVIAGLLRHRQDDPEARAHRIGKEAD